MTLFFKLILTCLTILSILLNVRSEVRSQQLETLGPAEILFVSNKTIHIGTGIESNQLPIFQFTSNATRIDFNVRILPQKQCNFTVFAHEGVAQAETITQLGSNKVLFRWSQHRRSDNNSRFRGTYRKVISTISLLDMNTCVILKNHEFTWDINVRDSYINVVPFEDSFDVFTWTNRVATRISFDINGNQIDKTENYPFDPSHSIITPVTVKSRSEGFFVLDNSRIKLSLTQTDGTVDETLFNMNYRIEIQVSHISVSSNNSLYSVCWSKLDKEDYKNNVIECWQYDESGNTKFNREEEAEIIGRVLGVKNLKDGGIVLATFKGRTMKIFEMKPKLPTKIWSYSSMPYPIKNARLTDWNESEHTFNIVYEARKTDHRGKDLEQSIVLQKYSVPKGRDFTRRFHVNKHQP